MRDDKDDKDKLIKIEGTKENPPRDYPVYGWDINKALDQLDINYRLPDYHNKEEWDNII